MSRGKRKTTVEPVNLDKIVAVIKTAHCPSRSGRSQLSYQLGKDEALKLYIKITDNTGNGYFNAEWLCLEAIQHQLEKYSMPFGAQQIRNLFEGKSVNTLHFVFAALLSEGFLIKDEQNTRQYRLGDVEGFKLRTESLSDPGTMAINPTDTDTVKAKSKSGNKRQSMNMDDESLLDSLLQSA